MKNTLNNIFEKSLLLRGPLLSGITKFKPCFTFQVLLADKECWPMWSKTRITLADNFSCLPVPLISFIQTTFNRLKTFHDQSRKTAQFVNYSIISSYLKFYKYFYEKKRNFFNMLTRFHEFLRKVL